MVCLTLTKPLIRTAKMRRPSRSKTRMRACVGSSSPSYRKRTTEVEASARSLSPPRRSRGEGQRSGAPNKIRMIFIVSKVRLTKILTNIIITMGRKTNLMHPVVMQRRRQKKEGRESVRRRRKSSRNNRKKI